MGKVKSAVAALRQVFSSAGTEGNCAPKQLVVCIATTRIQYSTKEKKFILTRVAS